MIVVAVLDGARAVAWQRACIDALRDAHGVEVRTVVLGARNGVPHPLARRLGGALLAAAPVAADAGSWDGADAILDLTADGVAATAPLGVWRLRLGDSDDAALPFAREIGRGATTVEVVLERELGGARETIRRGRFGVTPSYRATLRLALLQAARWPAVAIASGAHGEAVAGATSRATPRRKAAAWDAVRFAVALGVKVAQLMAGHFLEVIEWNVGFIEGGPRALLAGGPLAIRWLPQPKPMTFIADPFLIERDGVLALFVEEFDYARDRGVIDALVLDEGGEVTARHRVLDLPTHLSYPYPLEIGGDLYLVPENCAANEVALYRCVRFPDRWERARVMLPATDGVDTTIFAHEGRWWAFCTRWAQGGNQALYAYHAPSADGPWDDHAQNPIVVDVTSARPAGTPFVVEGSLYRPGQDCSKSYGCALSIARIDELTPERYRETIVRRIDPPAFGRYRDGIHTLNFHGALGVVDGKHVRYDVRKLAWAAGKVRGRIVRALSGR